MSTIDHPETNQNHDLITPALLELFDHSPLAVYTCDQLGYLSFYHQAAATLWGRMPQIGKELWSGSSKIYYPDGRPMPLEECPMAITLKTGQAQTGQMTIERPDGSFRDLLVFHVPIFKNKKLTGAYNTLVDITDQQNDGSRQAMLSAIVDSSDDAIISKDLNGIITSWNRGAQQIFGYSEQEMIGKSITLLIPDSRMEEETVILGNIRKGTKVDHFETIRKDKQGNEIAISLTVSPIRDGKGKIIGASKVARNVTAQLKAQEEIKKHTEKLEILNSIGKSITEKMDIELILQRVTDATTKITGAAFGAFFYSTVNQQGEALMLYTLSGAPKEAFERFGMPRNTAVFGPTFAGQGVVRVDDITKDPRYGQNAPHYGMPKGHLPVVSYLAVPVISTSGEVIGGLFFGHPQPGMFKADHEDLVVNIAVQAAISLDNSRLFEQVKSLSDKKDEFIALASHELKTPLTTIKGYLQVLTKTEVSQMSKLFLEKSMYQVEKLNNLVEELLHMSRIEAGKLEFNLEDFDLRQLLAEQVEIFRYTFQSHQLTSELPELQVIINGDRQRIEQAVTNLISNAVKYSPGARQVELKLEIKDDLVIIRVKDYGMGLSPEQQQMIFTRFYRAEETKGISGLGLGLYLSKQVIDRHNGRIQVLSEPGQGSEFLIMLNLKETKLL